MRRLREAGMDHVPVMVGTSIIPDEDRLKLKSFGLARVYTPRDRIEPDHDGHRGPCRSARDRRANSDGKFLG